ncbi:lipase family protein [Saccharopolyspora taberi]|uniref:Fungal lipase-type domain-containing protein n=1 Tax=Saccharopolyspora taberi TaxID=60895 RepID=A0ABN3VNQ1_9PSEU
MTIADLDHETTGYSALHAYWMARAADLTYSTEEEMQSETRKWGFERFRYFFSSHQMLPIDDTQGFVAGSDRMIILAFRGTEPKKIQDWLTDVNGPAAPGPGAKGFVHLGFHQALDSVFPEIKDAIAEFRDNGQTLWITGHSLGGALAMLAAARLHFEDPRLTADGVYTFGQPRTCDRFLANAYDEVLESRTFRFVNNNDIVPQVPPEPLYHHVKTLRYFDAKGNLREKTSLLGSITDKAKGLTSDMFAPATDGIRDHQMAKYVELMENNLR